MMMGWYTVRLHLEKIDQRKPGVTAALRRYLSSEADPPRTLRVATMEFIKKYDRSPRYVPSPWLSPKTGSAVHD